MTYVTLKGLPEASKEVERISGEAVEELESFPEKNTFLIRLVKELVDRKN